MIQLLHWPERRHGNDGVPECIGNGGERRLGHVFLGVEHDRREDYDRHAQREYEEAELAGTRSKRVAEDSQSGRVAGKLEDTEHSEHP